jgi:hypothetical protein
VNGVGSTRRASLLVLLLLVVVVVVVVVTTTGADSLGTLLAKAADGDTGDGADGCGEFPVELVRAGNHVGLLGDVGDAGGRWCEDHRAVPRWMRNGPVPRGRRARRRRGGRPRESSWLDDSAQRTAAAYVVDASVATRHRAEAEMGDEGAHIVERVAGSDVVDVEQSGDRVSSTTSWASCRSPCTVP